MGQAQVCESTLNKNMIDPKKVDLNKFPKKFIDGALGAFGKEIFTFGLASGDTLEVFATTPSVMKNIAIWMKNLVKKYEDQFGEIEIARVPKATVSPIQRTDLKKNNN
jgi:hypothetical protein